MSPSCTKYPRQFLSSTLYLYSTWTAYLGHTAVCNQHVGADNTKKHQRGAETKPCHTTCSNPVHKYTFWLEHVCSLEMSRPMNKRHLVHVHASVCVCFCLSVNLFAYIMLVYACVCVHACVHACVHVCVCVLYMHTVKEELNKSRPTFEVFIPNLDQSVSLYKTREKRQPKACE